MNLVNNFYHYIWSGQDNNCNSYLIADVLKDGGHVLIDPGHIQTPQTNEPAIQTLAQSISQDGIDPTKIGLILLTHYHPDHCEGALAFQKQFETMVTINELEAEFYEKYGASVDLFLTEGNLELSGKNKLNLHIYHVPGHSPGHMAIYCPKNKVLIAGDLVFYRSTGRVDLPGGNVEQMKHSIDRMAELDVDYLLCGHPYGHPGVIEGKDEIIKNFEEIKSMF